MRADTTVPTIGERVLSQRELNRALLARQGLLRRLPASTSLPAALQRVDCLQAQCAPSMYVGLWSRLDGFQWPAPDRALERRSVVQATRAGSDPPSRSGAT